MIHLVLFLYTNTWCKMHLRKAGSMERVTSHRGLKHGAMITVKDHEGQVVLTGQVVGFPYNSRAQRGSNQEPDMVQIRLRGRRSQDILLSQIGIGPKASPERRTYIV